MPRNNLRVLLDGPRPGPLNMAVDEALLESVETGGAPPTLRLYGWQPPTLSLGYFQSIAEFEAQPSPVREMAVVRRTTGGGAILHDLEVTYSLTLPHGHDWLHGSANRLYERAHQAVIAAVGVRAQLAGDAGCVGAGSCGESSRHGPFFCFARRYALDVVVQDTNAVGGFAKLAGSAQRRTRGAVLQHGSIILASRFTQQPCATWSGVGGPSDYEQAVRRLVDAFAAILGPRVSFGAFTPDEKHRATALEAKYASPAWTRQR